MRVREARPDEHDHIGLITMSAYAEFFDEGAIDDDTSYLRRIGDVAGRAGRTTILVAVDDHEIIGSLTLELGTRVDTGPDVRPLDPDEAHIRMLGVAPAARARGAGRALMLEAETRARAAGKAWMTLSTTEHMVAARSMYRSLGYERISDRIEPDGFVLLRYRRRLDQEAGSGT
jgi:ribosomal protein S18 acetylase RimI-like enzyme